MKEMQEREEKEEDDGDSQLIAWLDARQSQFTSEEQRVEMKIPSKPHSRWAEDDLIMKYLAVWEVRDHL